MPDWIADMGSDIWAELSPARRDTPLAQALFDRTGINDIYNHVSPDPDATRDE